MLLNNAVNLHSYMVSMTNELAWRFNGMKNNKALRKIISLSSTLPTISPTFTGLELNLTLRTLHQTSRLRCFYAAYEAYVIHTRPCRQHDFLL